MKKTHKILKICGLALASTAVLVLLGFVGSIRSAASCEEVLVNIHSPMKHHLVEEETVRMLLNQTTGALVGQPLNQINTRSIERSLTAMPHIQKARVYETIDKKLIIDLEERQPLVRVFDREGNTAFMDARGKLMPLADQAVLRIPIISGNFSIANRVGSLSEDSLHMRDSTLETIHRYATAIAKDPFWSAQIQQTRINQNGDFVAYPQVGNHTINFGPSDKMDEKLNRLEIFYRKGLQKSGWNKYSNISLKYKDQIVCTKK